MKLIRITTVPQSIRGLLKGQLHFMSNNGFEVIAVSSPGEPLQDVFNNEGVKTVSILMTRTISPLKDLKALIKLILLFNKEKPHIVHTHTPKAGFLGMLAAWIAGVPQRLHTVAGLPLLVANGNKRRLLNFIEKLTYSCATKVYPNSNGLMNIILQENFTKPSKLKVIGYGSSNGIDTSFFDPKNNNDDEKNELRKKIGLTNNDFVFLYVGRIVRDKGINELIMAFKNVNSIFPNTHLLLVGNFERELDPISVESEKEIRINPNIHALGYQNNIRLYFSIADVLTFPSYREGFPNVVMQAASMQLNSIVTDINGCNEIIEDSYNGWIIPVRNSQVLEEKMLWCAQNKDLSMKMGINGRAKMEQYFERTFVWNEILKEYKNLLYV